jgi:hypothetical protein
MTFRNVPMCVIVIHARSIDKMMNLECRMTEVMTNDENRDVIPSEVEESRGNCVLGSAPGSFDSTALRSG